MTCPAEKYRPYQSPLWSPPGSVEAAHRIIPGTKQCATDCPCWSVRRGSPPRTKMLLIHEPANNDTSRALCGSGRGWVTGVDFHSVTTCPECRAAVGKRPDFIVGVELVDTMEGGK